MERTSDSKVDSVDLREFGGAGFAFSTSSIVIRGGRGLALAARSERGSHGVWGRHFDPRKEGTKHSAGKEEARIVENGLEHGRKVEANCFCFGGFVFCFCFVCFFFVFFFSKKISEKKMTK